MKIRGPCVKGSLIFVARQQAVGPTCGAQCRTGYVVSAKLGSVSNIEPPPPFTSHLFVRLGAVVPNSCSSRAEQKNSTYLSAKQPGKADQVLSKFLDGTSSSIGTPLAVATDVSVPAATTDAKRRQHPVSPSPGKGATHRDAGFSTAR